MLESREALLRIFCTRVGAALLLLLLLPVFAAGSAAGTAKPNERPAAFTVISPIFAQLVAFSQPSSFVPVFEDANREGYIREAVPKGETVDHWTQMITVTGAKGLAANPEATPQSFAAHIATGYKNACPDTYSAVSIGDLEIVGHKAFAAIVACGTATAGGSSRSESALLLVIQGTSDYYTIQWAERAPASPSKPVVDSAKWTKRLDELGPIRLCPIVKGEKAPYPSCLSQK
jgi:hypothetical protein